MTFSERLKKYIGVEGVLNEGIFGAHLYLINVHRDYGNGKGTIVEIGDDFVVIKVKESSLLDTQKPYEIVIPLNAFKITI